MEKLIRYGEQGGKLDAPEGRNCAQGSILHIHSQHPFPAVGRDLFRGFPEGGIRAPQEALEYGQLVSKQPVMQSSFQADVSCCILIGVMPARSLFTDSRKGEKEIADPQRFSQRAAPAVQQDASCSKGNECFQAECRHGCTNRRTSYKKVRSVVELGIKEETLLQAIVPG